MDAFQSKALNTALGLVPEPPLPPVNDLLKSIVEALKKLGDKGMNSARTDSTQRHLAGLLSTINAEIAERSLAEKITANNEAQAQLKARGAALNQSVADAAKPTLGTLATGSAQ